MTVKPQGHASRSHALLSASKASRWINCTPSARLEDEYGEVQFSAYAMEGTTAHELAELYLRRDALAEISDAEFDEGLKRLRAKETFSEEMLDIVPIYTEYCISQLNEARATGSQVEMQIEKRFNLSEYVPESFGTADCTIITDRVLEVIDLKYGKGVPVHAEWNKQLMLYGLGALYEFDMAYDIDEVKLTIVQPRIDNISSFQISVADLRKWADEELKPAAKMAFEGRGELNPGEWCRFCAVKNRCRKLSEQQLEIARHEFADAELLSDDEIADIVRRTPRLIEWANSIAEYAQNKAISENKHWPGLKLVEGISRRKWADEDNAADAILERFPELGSEDIFSMKLDSITAIEKLVGKKRFAERLSDLVVKPQGKPALVPEEDKRPAMGCEQARADFSE